MRFLAALICRGVRHTRPFLFCSLVVIKWLLVFVVYYFFVDQPRLVVLNLMYPARRTNLSDAPFDIVQHQRFRVLETLVMLAVEGGEKYYRYAGDGFHRWLKKSGLVFFFILFAPIM